RQVQDAGFESRGYPLNLSTPESYAQSLATLHVPRQQYVNCLRGIPTIRVFEALACVIPLVCPSCDATQKLFHPGKDYLVVSDREEMTAEIHFLLNDEEARRQIAEQGIKTVRERHTCAHRAQQLISIVENVIR